MHLPKWLKWFFFLFLGANLAIIFTGQEHFYVTIYHTVLKGSLKPSIYQYKTLPKRKIIANNHQPWLIGHDYNSKALSDSQANYLNAIETVALLFIRRDSIRYEKYWMGHDENTLSNSFSMAKSIQSALIGIAITEGKIKNLEQPLSDFLPNFNKGLASEVTIKHLLTMSSGMNYEESYINPFSFPAKANYGKSLKKLLTKYTVTEQPGKYFQYRSGDTQLLAILLEQVVGKSVSEYAAEKLWNPIGARHSAFWETDRANETEKTFCCFNATTRDFARIGQLYLNGGKWNNNTIIKSEYIATSIVPADLIEKNGNKNEKYGLSWWITSFGNHNIFYARGILGQYIIVVPDEELIIVRLGHTRDKKRSDGHPKDVFVYLNAAYRMLNLK